MVKRALLLARPVNPGLILKLVFLISKFIENVIFFCLECALNLTCWVGRWIGKKKRNGIVV